MTDLLTANPKLDAVFAINDPTGIGCDLAAKQANRSEFFIVGVDGSPDAVAALKSKGKLIRGHPRPRSLRHGAEGGRSGRRGHGREKAGRRCHPYPYQADHSRHVNDNQKGLTK